MLDKAQGTARPTGEAIDLRHAANAPCSFCMARLSPGRYPVALRATLVQARSFYTLTPVSRPSMRLAEAPKSPGASLQSPLTHRMAASLSSLGPMMIVLLWDLFGKFLLCVSFWGARCLTYTLTFTRQRQRCYRLQRMRARAPKFLRPVQHWIERLRKVG